MRIILFKEFAGGMPNDSKYCKLYLESLNSNGNIQVIRHPSKKISLWSHHEKSVVIDQKIGYVGGVDLCFGRFELEDRFLLSEPEFPEKTYFPGADYNNVRIEDFKPGREFDRTPLISKLSQPRMPWRDIHMRIEGDVIQDLSRNFIQYWNFIKNEQ